MEITFDPEKAASNIIKHGISFDEAQTALFDENALVREDTDQYEQRFVLLGLSQYLRLLVVVYAVWDEENEVIRLISARVATKKEERQYAR
ncbi:BrnT family toxin [Acinetobacter ursingii]|uniref:BrnT family toxin n=1 Tax=Acinetobacter ursingii TaxID=108980 RepID=UPI00124C834C|nr:BrnT family toxin [Acinetobacter ursingii]MCU4350400.1 BrnT family toxin [Acinetobacter ursingii]MCU4480910.1 BrnT family toxin [Acinetobacter ursingii]MCU4505239.1 BrnT family toxin [Acinetobacter ursingii]MCU4569059.1 BrnT family toxin [Acinetobacter ursingii]MDI3236779.1 BrnT family toxin [Acinetobacter ursingii]